MSGTSRNLTYLLLAGAATLVVACTDAAAPGNPPPAIVLLALRTFDGSGQAVHPDPAITPLTWNGSTRQLAVTPYPYGDASKENPSLFTARSWHDWPVPDGVMNPIVEPRSWGYLSDPDELYNPDANELWIYYREVTTENAIFVIRAASPTQRADPVLVVSGPNHTIVSPSVVRRGPNEWWMWSVNSGFAGCGGLSTTVELRRSSDGLTWSAPVLTDLAEKDSYPWHIDVEWVASRGEFWAIYNVKEPGSCTTPTLHFATSPDGIVWTPAAFPLLVRGAIPAFADIVYRAAAYYDATDGLVTLWYSGARFENSQYTWRVATERLTLDALFARLNTRPIGAIGVSDAPPLTNDDAP